MDALRTSRFAISPPRTTLDEFTMDSYATAARRAVGGVTPKAAPKHDNHVPGAPRVGSRVSPGTVPPKKNRSK